ncbi:MAG: acyl carrier protein [Ruminococcus sp.]|nr:acyl carrier protein [Ruminococcus sp.]MDE6540164.1 acyl carrier protein [Ruminococcus sp.]
MFEKIKEIITNYVEVNPDEITENSRFIDDIGLNSYDFMCMLGDIEEEFNITVDEAEIVNLRTVGEAIAYFASLQ